MPCSEVGWSITPRSSASVPSARRASRGVRHCQVQDRGSPGGGGVWGGEWGGCLGVGLCGAFYVRRATLPHLRKAGGGAIVAISSIAAQMCQPRNVQGAAAKAGLEAMIRVIAREEGRRGIRANAVAIGLTDTDMGRAAFAQWGPEAAAQVIRGIR